MNDLKSKRVGGTDLSSKCFAYVGDEQKTDTWKLCIHVPGDAAKTRSLVATALHRFDEARIPAIERETVWNIVRGAAICLGLRVEQRTFAATNEAPAPMAEPVAKPAPEPKPRERVDPIAEAIFADADRRATAFLKSLGYE
jgi:hypothetical protein